MRADRGCHAMENIWIYSVKLNKWNKTNIKLKLIRPRIVLSSDEKYVIIMSGRDDNWKITNDIFILDIQNDDAWKLGKSDIRPPIDDLGGKICITRG